MSDTIFPVTSISREDTHWEWYLKTRTPVESHGGVYFKREDYFAPLGYGGPNGSKMRQLIWLVDRQRTGKTRLVSGASVKSPQLSMSAIVAAHYGLQTELVIGATHAASAAKHPNPQIAARFGARFHIIPVAYNPQLQTKVRQIAGSDAVIVEYGITTSHLHRANWEAVEQFHSLGARQVSNLPKRLRTLIVPAGSCNSLVSVLYGLATHDREIDRVLTLGIGPDKLRWVHDRLQAIEHVTGKKLLNAFVREWEQYPSWAQHYNETNAPRQDGHIFRWEHVDLQKLGWCTYQMDMVEQFGDIEFHPTYEGKMWRWLMQNALLRMDDTECFWIVGSRPDVKMVAPYATSDAVGQLEVI